ncbi:MAG: hypothetical protein A2846_02160 [Candidatus Doudnabacteria bacterium RIFCSPHIGHO2_01_FULL_49_9]|uniref:FAD/NAD(P)-binding domain-containing protein n=1 Tax=Candidatus Doudnabacteria bacterium RIFCSPHIGHO2_01_FULL_49_9 TaxID=1817827 RepID=A0A1F5NZ71_9BACT|nr:MAG: hypothetical protein A2846_02160 [Candidatus Doudnabacteria bacterium RIFCSPHIGHO2_01_FULL_49_9]
MQPDADEKKVLVVGGGFGGVACALALARHAGTRAKITLVSDKPHLEYTPALYRVVTGSPPLEVCIPLQEIFSGTRVERVTDAITSVDILNKRAMGSVGATYRFDYVVLAMGSQTSYFNIPGLAEFSFGFKSITEALRLKDHIHRLFDECKPPHGSADMKMHFVVVGAGASGVELAGELAAYTRTLAKKYDIPRSLVTIDLVEAASRIVPSFPEAVALKIEKRLHGLGVNIFTNRPMLKAELEEINLKGLTLKTDTVVWTAGVKPNTLYSRTQGLAFDPAGRVLADEYLRAKNLTHVFVIGDGAATPYAGMAQTAARDGKIAAQNIINSLDEKPLIPYQPKKPYHSLPVGYGWAATLLGLATIYGRLGWFLRKLADLRYFSSILPPGKAITAFQSGKTLCKSCEICSPGSINQNIYNP